jgi:hypothetical protein
MHHIALCNSCSAHFNIGQLFAFVIDPAEQELEEQAQAEDTNPDPEQSKSQCI